MIQLPPNLNLSNAQRRNSAKHPWYGMIVGFRASPDTVRKQLPEILRPIEQRAAGPRSGS